MSLCIFAVDDGGDDVVSVSLEATEALDREKDERRTGWAGGEGPERHSPLLLFATGRLGPAPWLAEGRGWAGTEGGGRSPEGRQRTPMLPSTGCAHGGDAGEA